MLQGSSRMRLKIFLCLYAIVVCFNGCATVADYRYLYAKKLQAWSAWHSAKGEVPENKNTRDFAKGYKAGFLDVARGGDGTAPPVAPKEYWSAKYSCGDNCSVNLWYEGFYYGALHALRDNYQGCYAVPSRNNCACIDTEACGGLANNQVILADPSAATDKHFTPDPRPMPNGDLADPQLNHPEPDPSALPNPESVEPSPSDQQEPKETLPVVPLQPTDGL
jgi:hypothetical protein